MKPARSARIVKNLISKSTSTATSVAQPHTEPISFYETCPHAAAVIGNATVTDHIADGPTSIHQKPLVDSVYERVKPYSEVPGPKPLPILGNTWR